MNPSADFRRISLPWALACMLACLGVAVLLNETITPGHGKSIFFALFCAAFITRSIYRPGLSRPDYAFLAVVFTVHAVIAVTMPRDAAYPGALLFPAGLLDIAAFYVVYTKLMKRGEW